MIQLLMHGAGFGDNSDTTTANATIKNEIKCERASYLGERASYPDFNSFRMVRALFSAELVMVADFLLYFIYSIPTPSPQWRTSP